MMIESNHDVNTCYYIAHVLVIMPLLWIWYGLAYEALCKNMEHCKKKWPIKALQVKELCYWKLSKEEPLFITKFSFYQHVKTFWCALFIEQFTQSTRD